MEPNENQITIKPKLGFKAKLIIIHSFAVILIGISFATCLYYLNDAKQKNVVDASTIKTLQNQIKDFEAITETTSPKNIAKRDTQRKNDMALLASALVSYQANNKGEAPTVDGWDDFSEKYLTGSNNDFIDPSGAKYILSETVVLPDEFDAFNPVIRIYRNASCEDTNVMKVQSVRSFAFQIRLENNQIYCTNN